MAVLRPRHITDATIVRRHSRHWSILALILALVCGQSAGLQLVAWAGMLATRLTTTSVSEAVASTFDGSSPCALCCMAAALDRNDRNGDAAKGDPAGPRRPTKVVKQDMLISSLPCLDAAALPLDLIEFFLMRQVFPHSFTLPPEPPPPQV